MGYDSRHGVVVLYGGLTPDQEAGHEIGDTWTWDGSDWTEVEKDPGPPGARQNAALISDGNRLIRFGGDVPNVRYFSDIWSWNGTTWEAIDSPHGPAGRGGALAAWDQAHQSLLVLGGVGINATGGPGAQGTPLGDAWMLLGGHWSRLADAGPAPLAFGNALWDGANHRVIVLFGIHCPRPSASAWSWDGVTWSQLATAGVPARWGAASAQDGSGSALVFGGSNQAGC